MTTEDVADLAVGMRVEARFSFGLNVLSYRGSIVAEYRTRISVLWEPGVHDMLDKHSPLWRLIKVMK